MAQAASTYLGEQRRRSTRLDHTLPIVVRGVDLLGQPFEERTATQVLSFHGCRYSSKHHLPKNTWLTLEVPASQSRREPHRVRARVAWIHRPRTLRELFHVGVELETGANIWGVPFPPNDWGAASATGGGTVLEVTPFLASSDEAHAASEPDQSAAAQDTYLERMLAESVLNPSGATSLQSPASTHEFAPLLRDMREHFDAMARQVFDEARAHAEQLLRDRTAELQKDLHGELRTELKKEQRITAEAFHQRWREEFEKEQASAKQEATTTLAQQVAAQVSQTQEEVKAKLKQDLESGVEQARAALAEWRRQAEAFQAESRSISESLAGRAEQRLEEKLARQLTSLRQELVSSGVAVPVPGAVATENPVEMFENWRSRLDSEMAVTRAQWSEILESSLDSAAQRLIERLAENSLRLLQSSEQKLAVRVAELEQESGRNSETARAALEELKSAFDREVARAKSSLEEFEKTAARFEESSKQLDASRQNSISEMQGRFDATVLASAAEVERRAAEASRQLDTRQQHAEEILRVHRERLRQVSEQTQREAAEQASAALKNMRGGLEAAQRDLLGKWSAELESAGARAANEASASIAKTAEAAVERFAADSAVKTEQGRASLVAAAERTLQGFQSHAEAALSHLHERVAARMDQSMKEARENLASQLVAAFDAFQNQGEAQVKEWSAKLDAESGAAIARHQDRLRAAGDAWVDDSVRQLDAMGRTRVDTLVSAAENAVRKACVSVFDGMAQAMREQLLGALGDSAKVAEPAPGEPKPSERRASA